MSTQAETAGGTVQDENITGRSHIDPDKHWIGESLPAASDQDTTYSGIVTSAGTSPFPARANHSHDHRTTYGVYIPSGNQVIPPGNTYLNRWQHYLGKNTLASGSTQVVMIPSPGVWEIYMRYTLSRVGGGFFTGEFNVTMVHTNGTYIREIFRTSMFDIPTGFSGFILDRVHPAAVDSSTNFQIRIDHSDVANWNFSPEFLELRRLHAVGSA